MSSPARQIEPFPTTKHVRYVPPKEHLAKALEKATQFEMDFIMALLHTAGRISELRELSCEDVDLERETVRSGRRNDVEAIGSPRLIAIPPLTGRGYTRQSREIKFVFKSFALGQKSPVHRSQPPSLHGYPF